MRRARPALGRVRLGPCGQLREGARRGRGHEPVPRRVVRTQGRRRPRTAPRAGVLVRAPPPPRWSRRSPSVDRRTEPAGWTATARGSASADCTAGTRPGRSGRATHELDEGIEPTRRDAQPAATPAAPGTRPRPRAGRPTSEHSQRCQHGAQRHRVRPTPQDERQHDRLEPAAERDAQGQPRQPHGAHGRDRHHHVHDHRADRDDDRACGCPGRCRRRGSGRRSGSARAGRAGTRRAWSR